jgi:hypothetical protein
LERNENGFDDAEYMVMPSIEGAFRVRSDRYRLMTQKSARGEVQNQNLQVIQL